MDNLLASGSRLPNEVELARVFGVGHVTLRSALGKLEAEGLIERIRSKGTFVTSRSNRVTFLMILPDGMENLDTPSRYIVAGIEAYAEQLGVTVEHCPASLFLSFSQKQRQEIKKLHHVRGIIFETGHRRADIALIKALQEMELPVVIPHGLTSDRERSGFLVQRSDEKKAFSESFRYLADRGHRRIAGLFLDILDEEPGLIRGFTMAELREFLRTNGLDDSEDLIALIPNEHERMEQVVKSWMTRRERPSAIICQSDRIAIRIYSMVQESGLRIPEDISIIGYSNYPGGQLVLPPLTTTDTLLRLCAQSALDKLLDSASWYIPGEVPPELITPCRFIQRSSVIDRRSE